MGKKIKAYNKGTHDAWELARKIGCYEHHGGLDRKVCKRLFPDCRGSAEVMKRYSYEEAGQIIHEYEGEMFDINVGDELAHYLIDKMVIVTNIGHNFMYGVVRNGKMQGEMEMITRFGDWIKTGRHVDLSELFMEDEQK